MADEMTEQEIRTLFLHLEHGDGALFFDSVADDVDWTVMGTHPLAGHYTSKSSFIAATFDKLAPVLPGGTQLVVEHVFQDGHWAVVELRSMARAADGMRFDNRYCWVCRFENNMIVEVRAYLDSWLVGELFRRNPIAS